MAHIWSMGHSKKRQKAAPPPLRSDLRFKEVPAEVLRSDVARIRESMGEGEVHEDMRMLVETMLVIREELDRKDASIQRLTSIIWGPKTESFAAVCRQAMEAENPALKLRPKEKHEKPKGHGRNAAADFPKARRIPVPLEDVASGEGCPHCPNGKVYPQKEPSTLLRITGVAPFTATV